MGEEVNKAQITFDLRRDEGVRNKKYKDSKGYWTAGVGHLIDPRILGRPLTPLEDKVLNHDYTLTDGEINAWLSADIDEKLKDVQPFHWWQVLDTETRRRAVLNMVFNMGVETLSEFHTFLNLLSAKAWVRAADDLEGTLWHRQVGPRAERIEAMIRRG